MSFTSQYCTSYDQSMELIELGIKKETADIYLRFDYICKDGCHYRPVCPEYAYEGDIPAWSLDRLIEMSKGARGLMIVRVVDNRYDAMIRRIKMMIESGKFNPEYLDEQKIIDGLKESK